MSTHLYNLTVLCYGPLQLMNMKQHICNNANPERQKK